MLYEAVDDVLLWENARGCLTLDELPVSKSWRWDLTAWSFFLSL